MSAWSYSTLALMKTPGNLEFAGSAVVSLTEVSMTTNAPPAAEQDIPGVYSLFVDCDQMDPGDQYLIRCLEKTDGPSAPQREVWRATLTSDQPSLDLESRFPLMHGWDFTIQKTAGVDRTFSWSIRA